MKTSSLPKTLLPFFWHFLRKHWALLLLVQFFSFAWAFDHTLWPYVMMTLIDTITHFTGDKADAWYALKIPMIMGISLWIVIELFFRLSGILSTYLFPRIEAETRMSMFDYVLHHSHRYFSNHMAGSIANKISDMPQAMTRLFQKILYLFVPVLLALVISTTLFAQMNLFFALILIGWVAIHMSICLIFSKECAQTSNVHAEARSQLSGKIVDCLTNTTNVRLFARSRFEYEYLSIFQRDEITTHWRSLWSIEKMKIALGIACFLGMGIALNWFMLYSWQQGELSTGEVVFIFNTTWNITMMAWLAGLELPLLFKEIGICRQALTIIQSAHDIKDARDALPLKITKGEISFDHVTFHYLKDHNVFEDKTITITSGQKVGLVGFSGSGKSTFVHLILRYYDIQEGHIFIDGQDIAKVCQDSLREQISMIPQDPILFHRSLMENIRYGRLDASDEEVIEASKKAHCHEFIMKMPEKYDSPVGERGVKISGGQRQRIAIARAILKNAPIIILDEATSALDSVTEKDIQEGLKHVIQGHTTLVIAHRLSTLSNMDRILVFKEGKIIEDGSHEELLKEKTHYAHLWHMQAGGFLIDDKKEQ
ncbi:MAG: ABC transporter ATP-binding protein [Parachlamydiaceae bacterium]